MPYTWKSKNSKFLWRILPVLSRYYTLPILLELPALTVSQEAPEIMTVISTDHRTMITMISKNIIWNLQQSVHLCEYIPRSWHFSVVYHLRHVSSKPWCLASLFSKNNFLWLSKIKLTTEIIIPNNGMPILISNELALKQDLYLHLLL
jgi:hypothetical protein